MLDRRVVRLSIAMVWLYQGLWCKLLGRSEEQASIISAAPFIGAAASRAFSVTLGLVECGIAIWVLSARRMRQAALVQTALLLAMNTAGLMWARRFISDPPGLLFQNLAFVMLIWVAAENEVHHGRG